MPTGVHWELLLVDDELDDCRAAKEFIEGETYGPNEDTFHVTALNNFDEALSKLEQYNYDVLILDVHVGPIDVTVDDADEEEGKKVLDRIKSKRFIPTIFYTKLPGKVEDLAAGTPIIQVVEKTANVDALMDAIKQIIQTGVPYVNKAMINHLQEKQREYMWDFAAKNQSKLVDSSGKTELAYILARRLALSLLGPEIRMLAESLGNASSNGDALDIVHPIRYYIMPPIQKNPIAGDIYRYKRNEKERYAVLLTPSCDFVSRSGGRHAKKVLFARCMPLIFQKEFKEWKEDGCPTEGKKKENFINLIKNKRYKAQSGRYHYLPAALSLPGLIVDFQQLFMMPTRELDNSDNMVRIASLDSPYSESLLSDFAQYFGRLGTPDLDVDYIINQCRTR